jgi:uncharacterized protein DUF4252
MRNILVVTVITLLAAPAVAQRVNIDFPGLADRAAEIVDVTLDAQMLRLASRFLSSRDADQKEIREIVAKLDGIYVRSYEFDNAGEYDRDIVDRVRKQLGPTWKKVVNVRSRKKENMEVYFDTRGDVIAGLVVISAEPRELTLVNIVGPIDVEKLTRLSGQFGIPRMKIGEKDDD